MGMIVDPILPPYILEHRPAVFPNDSSILTQKHTYAIEQIVIDVIHDGSRAIIRVWPLTGLPITTIKRYSFRVFEFNQFRKLEHGFPVGKFLLKSDCC